MSTGAAPVVLVLGGAFPRGGRANLGDVAQAGEVVHRIRSRLPGVRLSLLANADDEEAIAGAPLVWSPISYLRAPPGGRVAGSPYPRLLAVFRSAALVWNARRVARGRSARGISESGQEALDVLRRADALVVAGSGGFTDRYLRGVVGFWIAVLLAMRALGKPVVLSGQQIGPLRWPWSRWLVRVALRGADLVGVRDPRSYRVAAALGVRLERLVLTGDDAWELPVADATAVDRLLERSGVAAGFLAVQVRADDSTGWTSEDLDHLACVLDDVHGRTRLPPVFVSMVATRDGSGDRVDNARVAARLVAAPPVVLDEDLDAPTTKAVLERAAVAVGVSNHFLVFAAAAGTPVVGVHRSPYLAHKVCGLAELHPGLVRTLDWNDDDAPGELPVIVAELAAAAPLVPAARTYAVRPAAAIDVLVHLLGLAAAERVRGG